MPGKGKKGRSIKPVQLDLSKKPKAIIFDLDGVIVDSEKAHLKTFNQTLSHFGISISEGYWRRRYTGIGSRAIMRHVFEKNRIGQDAGKWVAIRADAFQEHIKRHGLPQIQGFLQFYRLARKSGVKVFVASGGHRPHIAESLRAMGIPEVRYVGNEDVERNKPAPDLFLLAAKKLKAKPSKCIVFEDSLAGAEAAARAGTPCIALATTVSKQRLKGKAAMIARDFRSQTLRRLMRRLFAIGKQKKRF